MCMRLGRLARGRCAAGAHCCRARATAWIPCGAAGRGAQRRPHLALRWLVGVRRSGAYRGPFGCMGRAPRRCARRSSRGRWVQGSSSVKGYAWRRSVRVGKALASHSTGQGETSFAGEPIVAKNGSGKHFLKITVFLQFRKTIQKKIQFFYSFENQV